jgi:hypothetical protein
MSTIAGTLTAGAWVFTGCAAAFLIFAVVFQVIRENVREDKFAKGTWKAEQLAKVLGKPSSVVTMLLLGGLASFIKALSYWGMQFGVGLTGPVLTGNYWGSQLSWIFYLFFAGMALVSYVCLQGEWALAIPYGLATVAGTFFVATFAPAVTSNQLPFAIIGPALFLILALIIGLFKMRIGWQPIVALVAMALVYAGGYYLPYILSPSWLGSISLLTSLIWYLIADCVIALWFVFLAWTAIDCAEAKAEFVKAHSGKCAPTPACGKYAKAN